MRFNFVLVSCFLFAPAVLAMKDKDAPRPNYWAGGILKNESGPFNYVTGTLTAPQLLGDQDSALAQWVAIDEDRCQQTWGSALTSGFVSIETPAGTQHQAFLSWFPHPPLDLEIAISTGDNIQVTLDVSDPLTASLTFKNLGRNQTVTKTFQSAFPLCMAGAGWMVGFVKSNGQNMPFSSFDPMSITDAFAGFRGRSSYNPSSSETYWRELDDQYYPDRVDDFHKYLTSLKIYSNASLTVTRLQCTNEKTCT